MYLAASRTHMVKCIFPASLLPSLAQFPWLSSLGRNPSSPQAGKTPGTVLTVSIPGQGKAEQPISHPCLQHHQDTAQITWFIPAFPHRQLQHAKEIPEAAATGSKPPALSAGLNFPCVCKGKKKKKKGLNGLLILIQHGSEGFSS